MRVAYLGPFVNARLKPFIDSMTQHDCEKSPGMGGYGLVELVEETLLQGGESIVITLDTHLVNERVVRKGKQCSLYSLPKRKSQSLRDLFRNERELLSQALEDSKPDVIHAHWTTEYALAALSSTRPTIVTAHDHPRDILAHLGIGHYPLYLLSEYVIRKAKYMSVVSPHVLEFVARRRTCNFTMIPNPVSSELMSLSQTEMNHRSATAPKITSVLDWNELKNPKAALLAFRLIHSGYPNAEMHLFGNGMAEGEDCELWCKRNECNHGVVLHGKVANSIFREQFANTSILLHTSRTEACSMVIAEAMILGVPIIGGTRSGGVPWQLGYGTAGLLVDINNPRAIADAAIWLLENEEDRLALGKRAKERARSLFDPTTIVANWRDIYSKVQNGAPL